MSLSLENVHIDYSKLVQAQRWYEARGYMQVQVPWVVSEGASLETAKFRSRCYVTTENEHLVGSAEQGFVQVMMDCPRDFECGFPYDKKLYAITPCFRREIPDAVHSRWFMKLELFKQTSMDSPLETMNEFIADAKELFTTIIGGLIEEVPVPELQCTDLMCQNLELGSYGFRSLEDGGTWVFGTGIALPRIQIAWNLSEDS